MAKKLRQYLSGWGCSGCRRHACRADDLRYLAGPLIVFDPAWGEDTPDWLRAKVRPARLGLLLAGEKELASEEEAVIYLMTCIPCSATGPRVVPALPPSGRPGNGPLGAGLRPRLTYGSKLAKRHRRSTEAG